MTSTKPQTRGPCLVCDAQSIGINFGVPTCMACKAFFRRNAVKLGNYEFVCLKDGDCSIDHMDRRLCNCCRLAKCFHAGMQKALILTDGEKEARRQIVKQNRQKKFEKSQKTTTLDLIQPTCIPPVIHNTVSRLSTCDRSLLSNIYNAYESTCITIRSSLYSDFPRIQHISMHTFFNEYSKTHQLFIEYCKRIPEFNQISINDKVRLLRNQFGLINNINAPIVHPFVSNNLVVSLTNIFGVRVAHRLLDYVERVQAFSSDPFALKLVLVILALNTGNFRNRNDSDMDDIYDDTLGIFAAQNIYVELLWRYILSRSSTELEAIRYVDKLIQLFLYLFGVHTVIDGYIATSSDEIEKMEPLMQSMWPGPNNNEEIFPGHMALENNDDV